MRFALVSASVCVRLLYLHSRNASTPPKPSRSTRQTTAAVVLLLSVSQGAVNQGKTGNEENTQEKKKRKNRGHLTWLLLEGREVSCNNFFTITKLTGTAKG